MKRKKYYLVLAFLCIGCSEEKGEDFSLYFNREYEEYSNNFVLEKNMFYLGFDRYFVYIYQKNCGHCQHIKPYVLHYIDHNPNSLFLLEYEPSISICRNFYEDDKKITREDFCILGTPALIEVYQKEVNSYFFGETEILEKLNYKNI